jgi:hypothetical protein
MKLDIEWIRSVKVVAVLSLISLLAPIGRSFGQAPF